MTVSSFNEETKILLFNVNERQREFRDDKGQDLERPRDCQFGQSCSMGGLQGDALSSNKALCEVDPCHLNPHFYLSKVACSPAGRGDYAVIDSTRDLAGQMKVRSVVVL